MKNTKGIPRVPLQASCWPGVLWVGVKIQNRKKKEERSMTFFNVIMHIVKRTLMINEQSLFCSFLKLNCFTKV